MRLLLRNTRKTDTVAAGSGGEFVNGWGPRPAFALLRNTRTTASACALSALLLLTAGGVLAEDVNQPAPELAIKMENGQVVKLSQYKGKPVVLEFFSTVCPHCQKSAESLEKTMRAYSAKGVQVIAVTTDENQRKEFPEFRRKYGATYPMGTIGNQEAYRFFSLSVMKPFYVPTYAFIDRNGVIKSRFIGGILPNNPNAGPAEELAEIAKHVELLLKGGPVRPATAKR